ncbi:MAG: hypothetical protein K2W95_02590 [Candidatus Obscuribacterales bacterium]|nr:hypothetical protein [Candidatus Obscuribacterales bacterium]
MEDNFFIVLVRPQFLGNLGSVARVMKNFGFCRLRLVEPPRNYKESEARRMSVGAFDVLKNSEIFSSLSDALADISLAVGTTSGQQRDLSPLPLKRLLPDLVACARSSRCAIVFGDEVNGLPTEDLLRCHHIVTIPTNPDFAALNMAQAVGIAVYSFFDQMNSDSAGTGELVTYSGGKQDDKIFEQLDTLLLHSDFSRTYNRTKILKEFRSFYQRAHPTERESSLLLGALLKLNQKIQN